MTVIEKPHIMINGEVAAAEDLSPLAFAGFAHFTAMQVRDGLVRGLDLHLHRLRWASFKLFGRAMPDDEVRRHLHAAVQSHPSASLTATMFSRAGEFTRNGLPGDPAILVRAGPPADGPTGPLRLDLVEHERPLFAIKHVGETAKTHLLRRAVQRGYDDAAFFDRNGRIGEATIWNLAFWDGEAVIWPDADVLPGVTMGIVKRQLDVLGILQRTMSISRSTLGEMQGAVVLNSWTPGIPVTEIGGAEVRLSERFVSLMHQAYQAEPPCDIGGRPHALPMR